MRWFYVVIVVLLLSGLSVGGYVVYARTAEARANEEKYRPTIAAAERKWGIPAGLLHRLLYQESRFRTDIITGALRSPAGAVGIAQFMPATARDLGVDPLDPVQAIDGAGKYLRRQYDRFGSWPLALAAYNAGPGNVSKYGGVPPFPETQRYVAEITRDAGIV